MAKADATSTNVQQILEGLVKEYLADLSIERVDVRRDEDEEGDPILRIVLVLRDAKSFDPVAASSFVRHLRPKLLEEDLFPLVSFISSADNIRKTQAAAN